MASVGVDIAEDDLRRSDIAALITLHVRNAAANSAPGSSHALGLAALRRKDITVWTARHNLELTGCVALRQLDARHGEIKSMRTVAAWQGRGIGRAMLAHVVSVARGREYRCLSLETGVSAAFAPARALYASFGFAECAAFGDYVADEESVFLTLLL